MSNHPAYHVSAKPSAARQPTWATRKTLRMTTPW